MIYRFLFRLISYTAPGLIYKYAYWYTRIFTLMTRHVQKSPKFPLKPVETMGLRFPNPVGLAAGFDRYGKLIPGVDSMGFGFVEIGTINADSETNADNDFTTVSYNLENMGIGSNPSGKTANYPLLGISLGSLRNNMDEQTINDYLKGMKKLWGFADYMVINLSRPDSQTRSAASDNSMLYKLLKNIKQEQVELASSRSKQVPIIVKVAIEYKEETISIPYIMTIIKNLEFDGILCAFEKWPCRKSVNRCVSEISRFIKPLPLIAVGGIRSVDDARHTLEAGARLVQLFSALTEQGPLRTRELIYELINPV